MRVAFRVRILLLAGMALLAATVLARADEAPPSAPYRGVLPEPPGVALDLDDDEPAAYVVRVLDGRTGLPVPGARVQCYPERLLDWNWRHDYLLAQGLADERGYAQIAAKGWRDDAHWVVRADGYGPTHDYGVSPPGVIHLLPSVDLSGRVLDPFGRPQSGVDVQYFLGCGHGPTIVQTTTNAAGHFHLRGVNPDEGQLWIEGDGVRADYHDLAVLMRYGHRVHDVPTDIGHTATGRVLDPDGAPVQGVVVRSLQCHRGPATVTDASGRFRLRGVEPGHELYLHHPATLVAEGAHAPNSGEHYEEWLPGAERVMRLSPVGLLPPPVATARVRVRAQHPKTRAPLELELVLVHRDTGAVVDIYTEASGIVEERLPPGSWTLRPASRFSALTFDPLVIEAAAERTIEVELVLRERPRLVVDGLPERWQLLDVVAEDEAYRENDDSGTELSPPVSAEGPVTIRLVTLDDSPVQYFHAGPLQQDGTRRITVRLPRPNRVRLVDPSGAFKHATLLWPGSFEPLQLEDDTAAGPGGDTKPYLTWATGSLVFRVESADGVHDLPLELPASGGAIIEVDPRTVPARTDPMSHPAADDPRAAVFDLRAPDGAPAQGATIERFHVGYGGVEAGAHDLSGPLTLWPGSWAWVKRPGWRTLHVIAKERGLQVIRWGSASLGLRIDEYGEQCERPATVWVDDAAYPAVAGRFELQGLDPGEHDVIVVPYDGSAAPRDDTDAPDPTGMRFKISLKAGERRTVTLELYPDE